jgi:hypothetical protein
MIKKNYIACLLLSVFFCSARNILLILTYGIGDVRYKGTAEIRSMAGIAVEQDSIHLNMDNPVSYANLKLTTFAVEVLMTTKMKSSTVSENARRTTIDYLAVVAQWVN